MESKQVCILNRVNYYSIGPVCVMNTIKTLSHSDDVEICGTHNRIEFAINKIIIKLLHRPSVFCDHCRSGISSACSYRSFSLPSSIVEMKYLMSGAVLTITL